MKLRNKKTGEIKDIRTILHEAFTVHGVEVLKNLEANWEDYKPTEPLIKDEKIRKAVRAWAKANDIEFLDIASDSRLKDCGGNYIEFLCLPFKELPKKSYYITELCGEEEE